MRLDWLGDYREVVESLIRYCNIYAANYKLEKLEYQGIRYSYSEIQVLEYLLESEDEQLNMSRIAARLGVTRSNFTKIVGKLKRKGLVEKKAFPGSRKEICVCVSPLGRALYADYAHEILRWHFAPMFASLDGVPREQLPMFAEALRASMRNSTSEAAREPEA